MSISAKAIAGTDQRRQYFSIISILLDYLLNLKLWMATRMDFYYVFICSYIYSHIQFSSLPDGLYYFWNGIIVFLFITSVLDIFKVSGIDYSIKKKADSYDGLVLQYKHRYTPAEALVLIKHRQTRR